jgi:muconolactone delta-isomerase
MIVILIFFSFSLHFAERQKQRQQAAIAGGYLPRHHRVSMKRMNQLNMDAASADTMDDLIARFVSFSYRRFKVDKDILYPEICEW